MNLKLKLSLLRFWGYLGVSCASIAIPMLVYAVTQSIQLAGLYLMIEWSSKIFFYSVGGVLLTQHTLRRSLIHADILRIIGCGGLMIAYVYHYQYLLLPCIVSVQVGNSLSNLVYEKSVFSMWDDKVKGYSAFLKMDYLAVAISVLFGIVFSTLTYLLFISFFIQCVSLFVNVKYGNEIFPQQEIRKINMYQVLVETKNNFFDVVSNKKLMFLILFSLSCSTVIAMVFSTLSFFVEHFDQSLSKNLTFISIIIAVKAFSSSGAIHFFNKFREKSFIHRDHYLYFGIPLLCLSLIGIATSKNLPLFLAFLFIGAAGNSVISVWIRDHRLNLMDLNSRNGQISIIIGLECVGYLISGWVLAFTNSHLLWLAILSIFAILSLSFVNQKLYQKHISLNNNP
jgi:hypothetical protein